MSSVLSHLLRLLIARFGLLLVSGDKRDAEILALRHQILVLQRQIDRPSFTSTDRTILALLCREGAENASQQVRGCTAGTLTGCVFGRISAPN